MNKKLFFLGIFSFLMMSCGSSKNVTNTYHNKPSSTTTELNQNTASNIRIKPSAPKILKSEATVADKIIWTAVTYKGTPYRYGGMSKKGIDCSGLIYNSFHKRNIPIARSSHEMYSQGKNISLREVQRGDLLFFKTSRRGKRINHVGLVTSVLDGDIRFIHSTTTRGVIVTSLHETYWKRAFIKAKRML